MVVDVPMHTDKHTVHVQIIIVVDVANFDTIDTIMSISTIRPITTTERNNHSNIHSTNYKHIFLSFFFSYLNIEINDCIIQHIGICIDLSSLNFATVATILVKCSWIGRESCDIYRLILHASLDKTITILDNFKIPFHQHVR